MQHNPLTTIPGQILGWRRARSYETPGLYPIYGIAGASPDGDGSGAGAGGGGEGGQGNGQSDGQNAGQGGSQANESGQSSAGQQGQNSGQSAASSAAWDGKIESLPSEAQALVRRLQTEASEASGKARENARNEAQQQLAQQIGKALGLIQDDEPADPAKLTAQLTEAQTAQRQSAVELAIFKTQAKHEGDPLALVDSRTFLAKVKDLDPAAADFEAKVIEAAKAAVTDNPKLKAVRAAGTSSVDHAGGSGEGADRPKSIREAIARAN